MTKPFEYISLNWQQIIVLVGFIVSVGIAYNDVTRLKSEVEYLKGRIDRKVNPIEGDIKEIQKQIHKLECNG